MDVWRDAGYPCEAFPVIREILNHQRDQALGTPRYPRAAQFQALETY